METTVIDTNFNGNDKTFIGRLHEDGVFDKDLFWPMYDEINALSGFYSEKPELPKDLVKKLFKIHGIILSYFTHHFDSSDNYKISNLSEVSHHDYMERIQCLFENFGVRQLPESMFDDELR
ncbi:MAG: hypothetical protein H6618_07740 [Deltaproteobacteria bacterium]|nr:hypothetical protein [Deltaproteobacteria bacterium]